MNAELKAKIAFQRTKVTDHSRLCREANAEFQKHVAILRGLENECGHRRLSPDLDECPDCGYDNIRD